MFAINPLCSFPFLRIQQQGIDDSDWLRSKHLLSILATVAEAGSSERSHLLLVGALGALLSMCLGDDSPFPELVRSPRPRKRISDGGEDRSSPVSPRRSYRSLFPSSSSISEGLDDNEAGGGGGGEESGLSGEEPARGSAAATGFYGSTRDLRQVTK